MRYLILSDIHSNWEALEAVLRDASGRYDQIACCGDLVGYGADPNRVVDWARGNVSKIVRGNHDKAVAAMDGLEWFNPAAQQATMWTRHTLTAANLEWVASLPKGPLDMGNFTLAHGTPLDEDEYLIDSFEARQTFAYAERWVTFFGHTHMQGGFRSRARQVERLGRPDETESERVIDIDPDSWYLVNPGSVGQPRDRDPRAAYALYEPDQRLVWLRRVPYDIITAQEKIQQAGLPEGLAQRLGSGR